MNTLVREFRVDDCLTIQTSDGPILVLVQRVRDKKVRLVLKHPPSTIAEQQASPSPTGERPSDACPQDPPLP